MILDLDQKDIDRIAEAVAQRIDTGGGSPWLDATEAAEYLRCSPRHLNKLAYRGELPTYRPAGKRLFRRDDLDRFVHQTEEMET